MQSSNGHATVPQRAVSWAGEVNPTQMSQLKHFSVQSQTDSSNIQNTTNPPHNNPNSSTANIPSRQAALPELQLLSIHHLIPIHPNPPPLIIPSAFSREFVESYVRSRQSGRTIPEIIVHLIGRGGFDHTGVRTRIDDAEVRSLLLGLALLEREIEARRILTSKGADGSAGTLASDGSHVGGGNSMRRIVVPPTPFTPSTNDTQRPLPPSQYQYRSQRTTLNGPDPSFAQRPTSAPPLSTARPAPRIYTTSPLLQSISRPAPVIATDPIRKSDKRSLDAGQGRNTQDSALQSERRLMGQSDDTWKDGMGLAKRTRLERGIERRLNLSPTSIASLATAQGTKRLDVPPPATLVSRGTASTKKRSSTMGFEKLPLAPPPRLDPKASKAARLPTPPSSASPEIKTSRIQIPLHPLESYSPNTNTTPSIPPPIPPAPLHPMSLMEVLFLRRVEEDATREHLEKLKAMNLLVGNYQQSLFEGRLEQRRVEERGWMEVDKLRSDGGVGLGIEVGRTSESENVDAEIVGVGLDDEEVGRVEEEQSALSNQHEMEKLSAEKWALFRLSESAQTTRQHEESLDRSEDRLLRHHLLEERLLSANVEITSLRAQLAAQSLLLESQALAESARQQALVEEKAAKQRRGTVLKQKREAERKVDEKLFAQLRKEEKEITALYGKRRD